METRIPAKQLRGVTQSDGAIPFTGDQSLGGHKLTNLATPTSAADAVRKDYVDTLAGEVALTLVGKLESPLTSVGVNGFNTGLQLPSTPPNAGFVIVMVNGIAQRVGDATVGVDCYFSRDGGITPLACGTLLFGDILYWNPQNAGFDLNAITDVIDFHYTTAAP